MIVARVDLDFEPEEWGAQGRKCCLGVGKCVERTKIPNRISIHLDRQHLPSFHRTDDDDGLEHRQAHRVCRAAADRREDGRLSIWMLGVSF